MPFVLFALLLFSGLCQADCVLTFEEAYRHLIENANVIKSSQAAIGAAQGSCLQAGLRINPEFNFDWGSIGSPAMLDEANELFVGATQVIELGGKRCARRQAAQAEVDSVTWDLEILKTELFGQLLHTFVKIAASHERVKIIHNQKLVLEDTLESLKKKNLCGKVPLMGLKQAELNLQTAKLKEAKAETDFRNALAELRGMWNGCAPSFEAIHFPIGEMPPLPSYALLQESLQNIPLLRKAEAEVLKASKIVKLEKTGRYPDISLQVGVTTFRYSKDASAAVGIDIPIMLFDRNQGNICRSQYDHSQALFDYSVLLTNLKTKLTVLYQEGQTSWQQVLDMKEQLMPIAIESYELAKFGHEEGKFECLDLFNARAQLFNLQEMYMDALEEYHHKRADILMLTALQQPPPL